MQRKKGDQAVTLQELKQQIKARQLDSIYIFSGDENLLKQKYVKEIQQTCIQPEFSMMNLEILYGKDTNINTIMNAADTLPFMDDRRILIVHHSQLFSASKNNEALKLNSNEVDEFTNYIHSIPNTTTLIFVENKVDKRNKLYNEVRKKGKIVEFPLIQGADLIKWIQQYLKKRKKKMSTSTIHYFITSMESGLLYIQNELDKLCDFVGEGETITEYDIDCITCRTLQAKIFDLVDGISEKNLTKALEVYNHLLFLKEPPIRILSMIIRQFRILYQVKNLIEEGCTQNHIIERTKMQAFLVNKALKQCSNFTNNILETALEDCLKVDISIKTGKMDAALAVELLIVQYSHKA